MVKRASNRLVFEKYAGVRQLRIEKAEDLLALEDLEEPFWMATSAPVHQFSCDLALLRTLDPEGNQRIRSCDIRKSVSWLFQRLGNLDRITHRDEFLFLRDLDPDSEEGRDLGEAGVTILRNLGEPEDGQLTLDRVRERMQVLARDDRNGDGVVPPSSVEDPRLRSFVRDIIETVGGVADMNGALGVDSTRLDRFLESVQALLDWRRQVSGSGARPGDDLFPLGDATSEGHELVTRLAEPIDSYFTLCRVAELNESLGKEVPHPGVGTEAFEDNEKALQYLRQSPIARPQPSAGLRIDHQVNPFYREDLHNLEKTVLAPILGSSLEGSVLRESAWHSVKKAFEPFENWLSQKPGGQVERLGPETLKSYLRGDLAERLRKRIREDLAAGPELAALRDFERLLLLQRWLLDLCNNFVSFPYLYDPDRRAMFETGRLVLEGRYFNLNVRVEDVESHSSAARRSGTFLLYSQVIGSRAEKDYFVVTPVTAGSVEGLVVGKRGVLFDLSGEERDTVILKVVANPVSLSQATFAPLRRLASLLLSATERVGSGTEKQVETTVLGKAGSIGADLGGKVAGLDGGASILPSQKPGSPDEKGSGGLLAGAREVVLAGGVTVAALVSSFAYVTKTLSDMQTIYPILVVLFLGVGLVLVPTGLVAYTRLRARNLGAILEASGWALNSPMRITPKMSRILSPRPVPPNK